MKKRCKKFDKEVKPEVILNNFNTMLGHRVGRMLASVFHYDPDFEGLGVETFGNGGVAVVMPCLSLSCFKCFSVSKAFCCYDSLALCLCSSVFLCVINSHLYLPSPPTPATLSPPYPTPLPLSPLHPSPPLIFSPPPPSTPPTRQVVAW